MANVKSVFDEELQHLKFDKSFLINILTHVNAFTRKDEETIQFLGSNLLGVYSFKWLNEDKSNWLDNVLKLDDERYLEVKLHNLPDINPNFIVSSNLINLSLLWVAHRGLTTPHLPKQDGYKIAEAAIMLLQYKFLSSLHTRRFPYPADEAIAVALYESLSRKFSLKKYGTWNNLIKARTDNILSKEGYLDTLTDFQNDLHIVACVNDIENRIRSIMNILTENFNKIKDADSKIIFSPIFNTIEGEKVLKEFVVSQQVIKNKLYDIIPNRTGFINDDLIKVVVQCIGTVSPKNLTQVLFFISNNFNGTKKTPVLHKLVDDIVMFTHELIRKDRYGLNSVSKIALRLREVIRSSRASDEILVQLKQTTGELVEESLRTDSPGIVSSTRVGTILYIALLGITLG